MENKLLTLIPQYSQDAIKAPLFEQAYFSCDDWRYYVPELLKNLWSELSIESRCVVYSMAEKMADDAIERAMNQDM